MLLKLAVVSLGGYATYKIVPSDQQRSDLQGVTSGFLNTFGAVYVVSSAYIDYKYTLKGIEYNTPEYYKERSVVHARVAERILSLSLKNRGVYLKAGQYIGNLDRIMPKEYTNCLKVLQDSGPSVPFDEIKIVIEHDLGKKYDTIFSSINQKAIAAASLAQVHEATLKETGQRVAVKIQFPTLRTQYRYDLLVIKYISKTCDFLIKVSGSEQLEIAQIFKTFSDALIIYIIPIHVEELDFMHEANNGERTKLYFKDFPQIHIPQYYKDICSSRLLVMEFVEGVKINDVEGIKQNNLKPVDCANLLVDIMGLMIFRDGHVHCDAHPGNIFIRPWLKDPTKPQLVLLDHGFYSDIDANTLDLFRRLWVSLAQFDYVKVHEYARKLGMEDKHVEYLPLIFFYRTLKSTKKLGEAFNKEDRVYVRDKGIATLGGASQLVRSMPPELLFVIRASNLVAIHNSLLGGNTRSRLKQFTKFAMQETYKNPISFFINYTWLRMRLFLFENFQRLYKIAF